MCSYPLKTFSSTEKSIETTQQHYNSSLHFRPSTGSHQDNVFRWPPELLDKNGNEKYPLVNHQTLKSDVATLKHGDIPSYSSQYNERLVQETQHGENVMSQESLANNNNTITGKREEYNVYNRPPFCTDNFTPPNLYAKTSMQAMDMRSSSLRGNNTPYNPDTSPVRSQPPVMSPRSYSSIRTAHNSFIKENSREVSQEKTEDLSAKQSGSPANIPATKHDSSSDDLVNQVNDALSSESAKNSDDPDDMPEDETSKKSEPSKKVGNTTQSNGDLPSYTAMIAQSILKTESSKSTLADIYEYMEKHFPSLERRGTGWRNCVRHTLSLNECFVKLHRPENGRSCNWAIHPTYYDAFTRGDYRKRRAFRKRPRSFPWGDSMMMGGFPFHREHDFHSEITPTQPPMYPFHSPHSMWSSSYNSQVSPNSSTHLHNFYQGNSNHNLYPPPTHQYHNPHCTTPDCFCQYNKGNGNRPYVN